MKDQEAEAPSEDEQAATTWAQLKNYSSFRENHVDADLEMNRLIDKGFVKKIACIDAERYFTKPMASRFGLILKQKLP